uniref:Ig-like domain-containing protein n=1 Tax=Mastacembelus armatus TaxID=205130 RepID=A0A3Q3SMY5_9TELE
LDLKFSTILYHTGNTQRTSDYSVVQSTVSDPVRPGDSVTLQCSVLSDSESDTCPRDHSVYWFRAGSDESHPNIIYTDGNNECEKRSDTVKSCVYHFSNISSSDAGTYYCAVATCGQILFGNGTKLDIGRETTRHRLSDPVRPGDSVTLQCSVLSDSESDTCPRDHSVYWFRAGSDESHPNIIYTDGNNECEKRSDTVKSCVYHFSNISSSDAGTYYCAVATCGQILFGDGTKLDIGMILCFSPGISPYNNVTTSSVLLVAQPEDGHDLNYAALHFSGEKATRGRKKKEMKNEESVYSQVKC